MMCTRKQHKENKLEIVNMVLNQFNPSSIMDQLLTRTIQLKKKLKKG